MNSPGIAAVMKPRACAPELEEAGFAIEYLTPFMASLSPLMWLSRGFEGKKGSQRRLPGITGAAAEWSRS